LPLPKENETTTAVGMCSQIGLEPYTLKLRATISPRVYSGRETQVEVSRLAREGNARRALARGCVAEVVLGAAVVALVSLFGLLDPN